MRSTIRRAGGCALVAAALAYTQPCTAATTLGGVNLGNLTDYLFVFTNGSNDANWQGATKGFKGDVAVNGTPSSTAANLRTSGDVPFAGTIYTNASTLESWQGIVNDNAAPSVTPTQAFGSIGQTTRLTNLTSNLSSAFTQINGLSATAGYTSRTPGSLDNLNTQNSINEVFVVNVTGDASGISAQLDITGDAGDIFIMRWDTDLATAGYQGQVKFQSGGGINPLGGLTPGNFVHVAGDLDPPAAGRTRPGWRRTSPRSTRSPTAPPSPVAGSSPATGSPPVPRPTPTPHRSAMRSLSAGGTAAPTPSP